MAVEPTEERSPTSRFEIVQTDAEQSWHVRLIAENGEPLSTSENLTSFEAARTNVAAQAKAFGWREARLTHGTAEPHEWVVQDDAASVWHSVEVVIIDERTSP